VNFLVRTVGKESDGFDAKIDFKCVLENYKTTTISDDLLRCYDKQDILGSASP
jgi:hypothetical protein